MGETKVLIETVHLRGVDDIQKLEQLHSNFQDARFIWETSGYPCGVNKIGLSFKTDW